MNSRPGRVALVTGAARGQGAAIVQRLRADGFLVAACDVAEDELRAMASTFTDGVVAIPLDVTSADQWDRAIGMVVAEFGTLSTLVNNAGVLHRAAIGDETPEGFEGSWRSLPRSFLGMRAALPQLQSATGASIVNTCSTGAIRPFPNHSAYGSAKWALRGLTQTAAAELAPSGIRVNAVLPGPVETPMLDQRTQQRLAADIAGRPDRPAHRDCRRGGVSWPRTRRRSSRVRSSSSTAASA